MNDRSGNGTGGFEVKIRTNTAKFTNMIIARFRESRLVREYIHIKLIESVLCSVYEYWLTTDDISYKGFESCLF